LTSVQPATVVTRHGGHRDAAMAYLPSAPGPSIPPSMGEGRLGKLRRRNVSDIGDEDDRDRPELLLASSKSRSIDIRSRHREWR
jgi:hypothetical protein